MGFILVRRRRLCAHRHRSALRHVHSTCRSWSYDNDRRLVSSRCLTYRRGSTWRDRGRRAPDEGGASHHRNFIHDAWRWIGTRNAPDGPVLPALGFFQGGMLSLSV